MRATQESRGSRASQSSRAKESLHAASRVDTSSDPARAASRGGAHRGSRAPVRTQLFSQKYLFLMMPIHLSAMHVCVLFLSSLASLMLLPSDELLLDFLNLKEHVLMLTTL